MKQLIEIQITYRLFAGNENGQNSKRVFSFRGAVFLKEKKHFQGYFAPF